LVLTFLYNMCHYVVEVKEVFASVCHKDFLLCGNFC